MGRMGQHCRTRRRRRTRVAESRSQRGWTGESETSIEASDYVKIYQKFSVVEGGQVGIVLVGGR